MAYYSLDQEIADRVLLGQVGGGSVSVSNTPANGQTLIYNTSSGKFDPASLSGANIFGDSSDGAATLDGIATVAWANLVGSTYTMTRDAYLTTLTVNNAIILIPNGFRVFVSGTLTNAGTIGNQAASASGTNNGTAGTLTNIGSIQGGQAGGSGTTGTGAAGSKGTIGTGGPGGAGTPGAAGAAQTGFLTAAQAGQVSKTPFQVFGASYFFGSATTRAFQGGTGGSAGGGDGTNVGGGGGAGGPMIQIFAATIVNNGVIQAKGGNGGSPTTGNCGGGGAGSGGWILIFSLSAMTGSGSTDVSAGNNGTHIGTGVDPGAAGTVGLVSNVVLS